MTSYLDHPAPGIYTLMQGRWPAALLQLAPAHWAAQLQRALLQQIAVPSPFAEHASFRFLQGADRHGGGICSERGSFATGFELLAALQGVTVPEVHHQLYRWLGYPTPNALPPTTPAESGRAQFVEMSAADRAALWGEHYFETAYPDAAQLCADLAPGERLSTQIRWHPNVPLPGSHVCSPARLIWLQNDVQQACGLAINWYSPEDQPSAEQAPLLSRTLCWAPPHGAHAALYANGDTCLLQAEPLPGHSTLFVVADLNIAPLLDHALPLGDRWRIWWLPEIGLLRSLPVPTDTRRVVFLSTVDWKPEVDQLAAQNPDTDILSAQAQDFCDHPTAQYRWDAVLKDPPARDRLARTAAAAVLPSGTR